MPLPQELLLHHSIFAVGFFTLDFVSSSSIDSSIVFEIRELIFAVCFYNIISNMQMTNIFTIKYYLMLAELVAHTFNSSTWESEEGRPVSLRPVWCT